MGIDWRDITIDAKTVIVLVLFLLGSASTGLATYYGMKARVDVLDARLAAATAATAEGKKATEANTDALHATERALVELSVRLRAKNVIE